MTIKLDHINLTVVHLKESIEWYKKIFGFKLVESGTTLQEVPWAIVSLDDSMICMSEYGNRALADTFEDKTAHCIDHFGIRINNIEKWEHIIQENSLRLGYGGQIQYPYSKSWYVYDPSGHKIEVSYTLKKHLQFPKGDIE